MKVQCSFEETVDLPDGGFRHSICGEVAEILVANDPCYGLCYRCAYQQLQAENKLLKEENRWIPVSERLPELIACGDEGAYMSHWVHITDGEKVIDAYYYDLTKREAKPNYATGKGWYCHGMRKKDITHWKPIILPKP